MLNSQDATTRNGRRVARVLSLVLFALWGAFFIEHLGWFTVGEQWPPANVWLLQAAHLALLAGLLLSLKWEIPGSLLTLVSALVFFSQVARDRFLPMFAITILPAVLFLVCAWRARGAAPPQMTGKEA